MCFHSLGAKTHKTSEQVRVVEKNGKSYTVKGDVGLSGLSPECRLYMELSEEVLRQCIMLSAKAKLDMFKNKSDVLHFDRCTFNACMFILGLSKVRWHCLLHCSSCYSNANQDSSLFFGVVLRGIECVCLWKQPSLPRSREVLKTLHSFPSLSAGEA